MGKFTPMNRGPVPTLGRFLVGATLVVALLSVDFPRSTFECRDVNLDLHKHKNRHLPRWFRTDGTEIPVPYESLGSVSW